MSKLADNWERDVFDRKLAARNLLTFLERQVHQVANPANKPKAPHPRGYAINIDAPWGAGKSYFLANLAEDMRIRGHFVVTIDAWAEDYLDDPMAAIMNAVDEAIPSEPSDDATKALAERGKKALASLSRIALRAGATTSNHLLARYLGLELGKLVESDEDQTDTGMLRGIEQALNKEASAAIDGVRFQKEAQADFKEMLKQLMEQLNSDTPIKEAAADDTRTNNPKVFVLVDELDRCRPTYAVQVMERLKHLFDVPDVGFIVATDTGQLLHTIRAVYGAEFDARRYLLRFFDRVYRFEEPPLESFVQQLIESDPVNEDILVLPEGITYQSYFAAFATCLNLSLRDIIHVFEIYKSIELSWNNIAKLQTLIIIPYIMCYIKGDKEFHAIQTLSFNTIFDHIDTKDRISLNVRNYANTLDPVEVFRLALAARDTLEGKQGHRLTWIFGADSGEGAPGNGYFRELICSAEIPNWSGQNIDPRHLLPFKSYAQLIQYVGKLAVEKKLREPT